MRGMHGFTPFRASPRNAHFKPVPLRPYDVTTINNCLQETRVQTFLPYSDYATSARVLDYKRLGKQRVETKQILLAMNKTSGGWVNHPATKMWRGYEIELCRYGFSMCKEWVLRGYSDSLAVFFMDTLHNYTSDGRNDRPPPWLGADDIHASHRSNLLRKDPVFYGQFGWAESPDMPYVWPVS